MTNTLEKVYNDLTSMGVFVFDCKLPRHESISSKDGYIGIDAERLKTSADVTKILIHESGHFIRGAFYNPFAAYSERIRAESQAERASFLRYIPYDELHDILSEENATCYDAAEHFGLPSEVIEKAYFFYRDCLGLRFD